MSRDVAVLGRRTTIAGSALLCVAVGGTPGPSHAAPSRAGEAWESLRWRAPFGCPGEAEVRARLAHALGPEVEAPQVDVEVSAGDDGRFHAMVLLHGPWGEATRRLDSPTCDTLADAVVLLAAVSAAAGEPEEQALEVPEPVPIEPSDALDGGVEAGSEPTPAEPVPSEPVPSEPVPGDIPPLASEPEPASPQPGPPSLRGLARVEARAGGGLLPGVDLGGALALGLAHRWFRVEVAGAGWLPRERSVTPDARVRASLWAVELRGCAALRPAPWVVVLPCVGLDVGSLRGEGRGDALAVRRTPRQPWVGLDVTPAASFRLHRLVGLWVGASAVISLRRLGLSIEGVEGDVHRVAPVAGRGALGVEIYFP